MLDEAHEYRTDLKSKKAEALDVLSLLSFRRHNPAVNAELEKLRKIISSIKI